MKVNMFEMQFFEIYYFANIVSNVLTDTQLYLRGLDDFCNSHVFYSPFPRDSYLKHFIIYIIDAINHEDLQGVDVRDILLNKKKLWVEIAFEKFDLPYLPFKEWIIEEKIRLESDYEGVDILVKYFQDLVFYGNYEGLLDKISNEVFFILFNNMDLLFRFNYLISNYIIFSTLHDIDEEYREYFKRDGNLLRKNIPRWVKKSVFYRDRGKCRSCHKDLSGLLSLENIENFDHIIPLHEGGINDVTNIQLLCENCNKKKSKKIIRYNYKYESWF